MTHFTITKPMRSIITIMMLISMQAMPHVKAFLTPSTSRASTNHHHRANSLVVRYENGGDLKSLADRLQTLEINLNGTRASVNRIEKIMNDGFNQIDKRFDKLDDIFDNGFDKLDKRFDNGFDKLDKRFDNGFDKLDKRFDKLDDELVNRFDKLDERFDKLDCRFLFLMVCLTILATSQIMLVLLKVLYHVGQ